MFITRFLLGREARVLSLLLVFSYFAVSCNRTTSPREEVGQLGAAQFGYDLIESTLGKAGGVHNLADARKIRLSIDSGASNNPVLSDTIVTIDEQDGRLTGPLVLFVNQYRVTKYEVLDSVDGVIFRAPDTASARDDLGQLVTRGLPFSFDVFEDSASVVTPQVLEILSEQNAEDFGSPYFGLDTIPTFFFDFSAVYYDTTINPNSLRYSSGNIDVQIVDSATVYKYSFEDTISTIRVLDFPSVNYAITLVGNIPGSEADTLMDTLTTSEMKQHVEGESNYRPRTFVLNRLFEVVSVTISGDSLILNQNSKQLTAAVTVRGGATELVNWSSSDNSVATVDNNGLVSGVADGSATIIATSVLDSTVKGAKEVFVGSVTSISITDQISGNTIVSPATAQLGVTLQSTEFVDTTVLWSSSDTSIARVDSVTGLVYSRGTGSVTITATSAFDTTMSDSYNFSVTSPPFGVYGYQITAPDQINLVETDIYYTNDAGRIDILRQVIPTGPDKLNATVGDISVANDDFQPRDAIVQAYITANSAGSNFVYQVHRLTPIIPLSDYVVKAIIYYDDQQNMNGVQISLLNHLGEVIPNSTTSTLSSFSDGNSSLSSDQGFQATFNNSNGRILSQITKIDTPTNPSVDGIEILGNSTVNVGDTITLTGLVAVTDDASQEVNWSSSDNAVATVDSDGNIVGVSVGTVTITATSTEDGSVSATKSISVASLYAGVVYGYQITTPSQFILVETSLYYSGDGSQADLFAGITPTGPARIGTLAGEINVANDGLTDRTILSQTYVTNFVLNSNRVYSVLSATPITVTDDMIVEGLLYHDDQNQMNGVSISLLNQGGQIISGTTTSALTSFVDGQFSVSGDAGFRATFDENTGAINVDIDKF
jgi:uncharacterized protein YjdB